MMLAPTPQLQGHVVQIGNGLNGIYQTLRTMRNMVNNAKVDPKIRQIATSIVFLTPAKNDIAEVEAIFQYVQNEIRYTKDVSGVETLTTPLYTALGKIGDCDDKSTLLASLLETVGYPTRFVIAGYNNEHDYEHVYVQVLLGGQWTDLDATELGCIGYAPPDPQIIAYEVV